MYKEDPNELVDRFKKIQHKEETESRKVAERKEKWNHRELLQKSEREKAMDHLLQLRRNNLMRISRETDI